MNVRNTLILLTTAVAFSCSDDNKTNNTASPCGSGVEVSAGTERACVYQQELIEEGFACPELLPYGFNLSGGGVACVSGQEMPPNLADALSDKGYNPDDPTCFDASPDTTCFYDGGMACSDVGCADMIILSFQNADGEPITAFEGTAQFNGETLEFHCTGGDPTGSGYGCNENMISISGVADQIVLDVVDLDSAVGFQGTLELSPQTIYPNGEDCPGECEQATTTVTMVPMGMACTEIGCSDTVILELVKDGTPVTSVTGSVELNAETIDISCVQGDESGPQYGCLNGTLRINGIGTAISVDLMDSEGATFQGTITLTPEPVYPNGVECGAECDHATATVTFQ